MTWRGVRRRAVAALSHPDLAWRRLRGGSQTFTQVPWSAIEEFVRPGAGIVEAGAADGCDTVRLAKRFPESRIFACEPVTTAYEKLRSQVRPYPLVEPIHVALADHIGKIKVHVARSLDDGSNDSSSILTPLLHESVYPSVVFDGCERVDSTTLDDLANSHRVLFEFAWLDLQGAEMMVLASSPMTLSHLRLVYMEVSRKELYSGMPTYREVLRTMSDWGFSVIDDRVGAISGNVLFRRN